jgi:hypothetical protein
MYTVTFHHQFQPGDTVYRIFDGKIKAEVVRNVFFGVEQDGTQSVYYRLKIDGVVKMTKKIKEDSILNSEDAYATPEEAANGLVKQFESEKEEAKDFKRATPCRVFSATVGGNGMELTVE